MKKLLYLLAVSVLIILGSGFFVPQEKNNYAENWTKVEKYVKEGLPKSALKIVDDIYRQAKDEDNKPQTIKSLIYRVSLQSRFEEEHLIKSIQTFEYELKSANSPEKQLLHSLTAELYQWFYQQNRWKINNRGVVADFEPDDLQTWDAVMINKVIRQHYLASIKNKNILQNIKLDDFEAILSSIDSTGYLLRPSLFDLLGNRALDYFTTSDAGLADIGNYFTNNASDLLLPADEFVKVKVDNIDSASTTYTIIELYKHLLGSHLESGHVDALVDLDLKRLNYMLNNSDRSEELINTTINTLERLRQDNNSHPTYTKISADLARKYIEIARKYNANEGEKHRFDFNTAEQICEEAIDAFPDTKAAGLCKSLINEINKIEFDFQVEKAVYPEKQSLSYVSFKNIKKLYFKIVSVNPYDIVKKNASKNKQVLVKGYLKHPTVQKWTQKLPDGNDHQKHTTEIILPALASGYYIVFASASSSFDNEDLVYHSIWVSPLAYFTKNNPNDGNIDLYVVDRQSGIPESGVNITTYEKRYNTKIRGNEYLHAGEFTTDKSGYAKLDFHGAISNVSISFMLEKDCAPLFSESDNYIYLKSTETKPQTKTYLFSDRAIYRPGQTVYFKGIVVDKKGDKVYIKQDYSTTIEFRNVNRKEISRVDVTTNNYGSFQGAFVIPKGGLNGQMSIKTKTGSLNILVEEYKRPTFQVKFDTVQGEYKLGDEVNITGFASNYAGNSVMNASVKYRVVRSEIIIPYYGFQRLYRPYPYAKPKEIANGTVTTGIDGEFNIQFIAEPGITADVRKSPPYQFTVYADVTDLTGEVQSASTNVSVGKDAIVLMIETENKILKESVEGISVHVKNLSGAPVKSLVELSLYKLQPPAQPYVKRYWQIPDTYIINEQTFNEIFPNLPYKKENERETWSKDIVVKKELMINGKTSVFKETLQNAGIGEYQVTAKTFTANGDTVTTMQFLTLFSSESKKLPGKPIKWFHVSKEKAEPGETVQLSVGSATKKAKVFYEIINGNTVVESDWITLNNSQKQIDIPVLESYRGNFAVNAKLIKHNRYFTQSFVIEVPFSNKKLDVELETNRDHLTPGKKEEWRVTISGPDGERIASELMAGMYDASLDQFKTNTWNFNLYSAKRNASKWISGYFSAGWSRDLYPKRPYPISPEMPKYPNINWFGYQHFSIRPPLFRNEAMELKTAPAEGGLTEVEVKEDKVEPISKDQTATGGSKADTPEQDLEESETLNSPRTNFNETAFFYPQLKTDSTGKVVFSFSTPDALTEWKLMMMAHSEDLKVGQLVNKIKANKELMVIPNLPRFVRQGDRLVFSAKVVNYTDTEIAPEVIIEFFDPISLKTVNLFAKENLFPERVTIKAKQSVHVSWEIIVPSELDLLAYRIKATSNTFSDSEERIIPVLTNRMMVTETLPMPLNGKETRQFSFADLVISDKIMAISTRKNYRFTVEFTSNPAWYAVQALPYLSEPKMENAGNLYRRFYANTLSSFIVNSNPKIKNVFHSWAEITPDAFYSKLQKNEELKNVILNATPWVLEAENETEQKRRIGILFDLNRISNEKIASLAKLQASQLSNGAWPWFKGMREDRHTTQQIVLGIGKLISKNVIDFSDDRDLKNMTRRAVNYLDDRINVDFEKLKKNNPKGMKNNQLSNTQIEYLYARALLTDDFPIPSKTKVAFDYYFGQAKKYWLKKSNFLQGMIAITMNRYGHRNEAEGIMRSLKERALYNDEMGMYWRQEVSWRWYEAPVETQAMMIDAFELVLNDLKSVEQMKVWLLKQKQTTNWKTTGATADAVYALLFTGLDLLSEDKLVEVKVGSETIFPEEIEGMKVEAGTGYFKTIWKGEEIKSEMGNIEVINPNNSIAWGAAYWQYFEFLDRIKAQDTPLTIEKQMFIEILTDEGPRMNLMEKDHQLKTGDKVIVRMVISTDRNMEYVHLKDMRASALEPVNQLSGYSYNGGLGYYRSVTDVSTEFFIQHLNKGTYVLEYPMMVTQKGEFSNGIASIQSYYAPEFAAHSEGKRIVVK